MAKLDLIWEIISKSPNIWLSKPVPAEDMIDSLRRFALNQTHFLNSSTVPLPILTN
jgi:hypothetical protein